ncbi:SIMPL domain-containing protein [Alcanivorax jadensis]|uniref:SIMPL domain-containing protein n=1 Tax=Alcanivorax jadensis TaxID=64988 RepID=UPI0026EF2C31|nr:SIMPL domain-containing protein [Alcanivorax jadensis]
MKRITAASLIALGALSLAACSDTHQTINSSPDSITVSGSGDIAAQPDIFRVVATAREQGDDIAAMKSRVDDAVADMLDLADDLDIEEKQVRASDLNVQPQWQYQPERKLIGHQVSRQVTFRANGLDTYTQLLDGLAKQGLRDIRPAGTEVSNADELANQALEKAVADARQRASIIAKAADRELGKAIQIQAQDFQPPQPVMMMARSEKSGHADSYRPGETDITARVQITFELD